MNEQKYDALKIENQLCFPLYAASREVVKHYKPLLDPLDLTYTQYIAMMVLWEQGPMTVKALGDILFLDSGTLTPLLKKLEAKGYLDRKRSTMDERSLTLTLTPEGEKLRDQAVEVPLKLGNCTNLTQEEAEILYRLLYKILGRTDAE